MLCSLNQLYDSSVLRKCACLYSHTCVKNVSDINIVFILSIPSTKFQKTNVELFYIVCCVFVLLIVFAPLLQYYVVLNCYAVVSIIILSPHIYTTMFFFILYLGVKRSLKCNTYTDAIHPANANMCCSQFALALNSALQS